MPTGTPVAYVSGPGTENDHLGLPRADRYREPHTQRKPKPAGLDWGSLAPVCKGCGAKSGTVNFRTGLCSICAPTVTKIAPKLPTEEKPGKPTTRRSAPRASANGNTGRAPVVGPSTTREMNPAAAQETRPAAAAGTPDVPADIPGASDLELGSELVRATRLLTESHGHTSPAVQALRGRVLGVLDALEAFLDVTRDRPRAQEPAPPRPRRVVGRDPDAPRRTGVASHGLPVDEGAIVREYVDDKDTVPVIAARHDVWPARIRLILDRHGIERRDDRRTNSGGRNAKTIDDYDPDLVAEVKRLYVDEEKTTVQVAEITGHSQKFIATILERAGIPRRPPASAPGRKGRDQKLNDDKRTAICRRYQAGESSVSLAKEFEVSTPTVLSVIRARGVHVRTKSEARLNSVARPSTSTGGSTR